MHPNPENLHYQLIQSVTDYALIALDEKGLVLSWNPGAERIKGYRPEEIIGRHFSAFYPPEAAAGDLARKLEIAAREGRVADEGWRVRKDGSRFWAYVVITAIRNGNGVATGFSKVTRESFYPDAAEAALRLSEERFGLLVRSVKDYAILLLDTEGRITTWNEGAERIKGYSADEILGRSFELFYPQEAIASGFPRYELEVAAREGRFEDENWRLRKDGSRFWANVVITALRNEAGELVGYAKVTRDLTVRRASEEQARRLAAEAAKREEATRRSEELARLNRRLREANRDLQVALSASEDARASAERATAAATAAYRELDQFAYVASHDLKAPLRGIGNLAQWIQDDVGDRLEGESVEHLRLLQKRVQRMEALIDGILTYSRAGRVKKEPERVDTDSLVREVVELVVPPDGADVEIQDGMPTIHAEMVPLQQVFMNLIGNAVKFSSAARSSVKVTVGWRDLGDAYEFSVRDNGPGIPPEYQERIWTIFQTLAPRDRVEGTGVGLSVVKKIVESRGGRVSVESVPGKGATFRFILPKKV